MSILRHCLLFISNLKMLFYFNIGSEGIKPVLGTIKSSAKWTFMVKLNNQFVAVRPRDLRALFLRAKLKYRDNSSLSVNCKISNGLLK